jgi:hypothetical protein
VPALNFPGLAEESQEKPQDDRYSSRNSTHPAFVRAKVVGKKEIFEVFEVVNVRDTVFWDIMQLDITSKETILV